MKLQKLIKDANVNIVTISYKIMFIGTDRFMMSSLSNLVYNLAEVIRTIRSKECGYFLEYESVNDDIIKYKCFSCIKNYSNKIDEEWKSRIRGTFKFPNNDINKCILFSRKGFYPYEYIDEWESLMKYNCQKKIISIVM